MTSAPSISHSACRIRAYDSAGSVTRAAAGKRDARNFHRMIGAGENLAAHVASRRITPHRLISFARHTVKGVFGAGEQARERQLEGSRELDQHHRGRARLAVLDPMDRRLGDA